MGRVLQSAGCLIMAKFTILRNAKSSHLIFVKTNNLKKKTFISFVPIFQTALSTPFPFVDSAKLERIKMVRFKLLCIVNYKVNYAISIVNYTIPSVFKSLSAIIF